MSTGLVYNFLYDPEKKLATTDYYLLHQFIFSAVFMMIEVFCSSIPIRFYHVIYCWPVVGLYSGLLYWHNQGTWVSIRKKIFQKIFEYLWLNQKKDELNKFPLFHSDQALSNVDHLNDKWLIVLVIFIMTTGVYLFIFSLSLFKWTCVALNGSRFESDVTPRFKTRDIVHEEC